METKYFKHNKTRNLYIFVALAPNRTHGFEGKKTVIYKSEKGTLFTRDEIEFYEKFTPCAPDGVTAKELQDWGDNFTDLCEELGFNERVQELVDDNSQPWSCAHANEVPGNCPCEDECYCKTHSCKETK